MTKNEIMDETLDNLSVDDLKKLLVNERDKSIKTREYLILLEKKFSHNVNELNYLRKKVSIYEQENLSNKKAINLSDQSNVNIFKLKDKERYLKHQNSILIKENNDLKKKLDKSFKNRFNFFKSFLND